MTGYTALLLIATFNLVLCCEFPNGTETAMHWWDCGDGHVNLYSATPLDENGNPEHGLI